MARLLQLTDLHVVAPGALASGVVDTRALLRQAVDHLIGRLEAIGPIDAVVVTGDVSDDGSDESYAFTRAELDRLGRPILIVPGNHDRREGLRGAFNDLASMPEDGLIDWVVDVAGSLVVGLDTLVEGQSGGRLRRSSLQHLGRAIAKAGGRPIVVALHHPPLRTGIRFMDRIGLENADDLSACLSEAVGPLRILAGHVHGIYHGQLAGHPVSTAPSLCSAFALDLREQAPIGFMSGPRGCALIDSGPGGIWTALPLDHASGPYAF